MLRKITTRNVLLLLFGCSLTSFSQDIDRFAAIGNKVPAVRTHLLEVPQPPQLDTAYLPIEKGNKHAFFPLDKLDTQDELNAELNRMRSKYAPFMQNLAPAMNPKRAVLNLKEFKWRKETENDKSNFERVLNGKGSWDKVTIPHYGEPLGEAITYYYREFYLTEEMLNKEALFIHFDGVDYKADVFINGYYLGSHEGFFAPFEFDFTKVARKGTNKLLVKVSNHEVGFKGEKIYAATGPGYDEPKYGWHHCPAGMGIYQSVVIEARSHLHVNDLFVRPVAEKDSAELWIEINNTKQTKENVEIEYSIYGQNFDEIVCENSVYKPSTVVVPGLGDLAKATDGKFVGLPMLYGQNFLKIPVSIPNARKWSNETPWLYQLQLKVKNDSGIITDVAKKHFGMRSFSMDTVSIPKGALFLNNKPVRLRGANTMGHLQGCVMREDWDQLRDDILLAKICNMNFIRMTQRPVQSEIYDYCDMLGMMTQTDLPLFGFLRRTKFSEAVKQAEEMERLVRSHPCNIMLSYINERFPNANGKPHRCFSDYADYEKFYTAASQSVLITNPDRVIKPGDGDYDPPSPGLPDSHCYNMWYNGHGLGVGELYKGFWQPVKPNWLYACGEYGAEGLDPVHVMEKYYPKEWLKESEEGVWLPNNIYKCQTPAFHIMWYNDQKTKQDWVNVSQDHQALVTKWMTEAFRRDSRIVSSAIHLFIDAWPGGWMKTIMDVDRQPKKAYYAYRDALSPIMVSLRSDRNKFFPGEKVNIETWICNDTDSGSDALQLNYQIEQGKQVIFSGVKNAIIPVNSSYFQGFVAYTAPQVFKRTSYKLRVALVDKNKQIIHENEFDFDVFPSTKPKSVNAFVIGDQDGISQDIANRFCIQKKVQNSEVDVILMDGKHFSKSKMEEIEPLVQAGKKLIIFNLPVGKYALSDSDIEVIPTFMGQYYFVSTTTEHPFIKDFKPEDFKFWYNSEKQTISPILGSMILADDWNMILKTGIGTRVNSLGFVDFRHAVAEKRQGKGSVIISQLDFDNMLDFNPVAVEFLQKLIR